MFSTRSATCPWPAGRSSASSTRSTCRCWRSAGTGGRCGTAVPQKTGRHSHPKAKPEQPDVPPRPTGIDYLGLLRAEHEEATRRDRIRYDALARRRGDGEERRRAAGDRRPGRAGQRRARLGCPARRCRPAAGTAETAAYLTAKAAVLERIAAERAAGGWSPEDVNAARAAARARQEAAGTAALAAAAGITALED